MDKKAKEERSFKPKETSRVPECEQKGLENVEILLFEVGGLGKHLFNFFEHCFSLGAFRFKFQKEKFNAKCFIPIAKSHSTLNEGTYRSFRLTYVTWPFNEIGKMDNIRQVE